ncbi:sugar phosphorylase [Brachybacterium sp. p3-SID1565]|uniref:Sugar phosphorylase n=1 Tax=Brachybacterium epidermidis TaxID=2781983 RepID=A0ABR9VZ62_9MICO|nr:MULTISPECIES: sugar phosphorylase [Brachybacterium]MBE9403173.1 sugar phosphorylase [Brachybacterium epidermidis]MCT1385744.1 sugar phosphorylase [Brachybacterium sp. p3-SID1565]
MTVHQKILADAEFIYGDHGPRVARALQELTDRFAAGDRAPADGEGAPGGRHQFSRRDAVLITYADSIRSEGEKGLGTLARVLPGLVGDVVDTVHLLPFFPWTSDDGFSVSDYLSVDPELGDWDQVEELGGSFRLMFDAVVNHMSASHPWFEAYRRGEHPYRDYVRTVDPATDLSGIVRPRTSPLLTPVETSRGIEHVWTTFSADQIDLDYETPEVLLEIMTILLEYVERGASLIRLDAVTYLWKEIGTSGVHHPRTHRVVQLMRHVLDAVAPGTSIITETNVPHEENISYFGNGRDEAQLVYNFALPPLVLHSFVAGDATVLSDWAASLSTPSDSTHFFNFLASHDGIGVRGAEAFLDQQQISALAERVEQHGGLVSSRSVGDGPDQPYELNINYFDALSDPGSDEDQEIAVRRFLTAQAIMLALPGVPGIYIHSLLGSRGWPAGVQEQGYPRAINREKLDAQQLIQELSDPEGRRARVLEGIRHLMRVRRDQEAFEPTAPTTVHRLDPGVLALERGTGDAAVMCLHNVTDREITVELPTADGDLLDPGAQIRAAVTLAPWQTRWVGLHA